jgi:hypothetical protein
MNNKNRQNGSIQIIAISLIAIVIIGALGYLYWNNFVVSKNNDPQAATVESKKSAAEVPIKDPNEGYLAIKEWGVRVKMRDASKVQYEFHSFDTDKRFSDAAGTYREYIIMSVKPEFLQDKNCKGASVGLYRLDSYDKDSAWTAKEIASKNYIVTGSPYVCDGSNDSPDNVLGKSVLDDFKLENLSL